MAERRRAEPWLTKSELARELRVSTRTIVRLRLPYMRVGGQNRYVLSEVRASMVDSDNLPDNVIALRPRTRGRAA